MEDYRLRQTGEETQAAIDKAEISYHKPDDGIPSTDMTSEVQTSLEKAESAYQKPAGGIPESDLTSEAQTKLDAGGTAYQKPSGGIPKTDMASGVQTSLENADSAYQKPTGGIPKTDMASGVQTSLGKADSAYQKPSAGIPATDMTSGVQTSLGKADSAYQKPTGGIPESDLTTEAQTKLDAGGTAYQKPAGGIPKTDMASGVQTSLENADSAYQKPSGGIPESDLTSEAQTKLDAGGTAYQKPSGGIPKTDMASGVQTSLGKADSAYQKPTGGIPESDLTSEAQTKLDAGGTAYQKPSGGIPKTDMASGVQTSLGKADSAYQKPSGGIPESDLTSEAQTKLDAGGTAYQKPSAGIPATDMTSGVQTILGNVAVNAEAIAALRAIVEGLETIAEGYVRVAGSSSPSLSYKSYKYSEAGGFGHESVFHIFWPCLVGTALTGAGTEGKILHQLKKLDYYHDIYGNERKIDGSEGDVQIVNIERYYCIMGKHTINGTEYDVFLVSLNAFTWQGIEAEVVERGGMSPDYTVSHTDTDNVVRMHSAYNPDWNGSYGAPVGVTGKYVQSQDAETGDITETYDSDTTLLGGAGGCHTTDLALYTGEQYAMNNNGDTTKTVPWMNSTAAAVEKMFAVMLAEGGTFDAHNASLMGSGFSSNDGATSASDWDESASGAKNGMRFVDKNGTTQYRGFGYLSSGSNAALKLSIRSFANMINSWRNGWKIMEAHRAVMHAITNHIGELTWFVYDGNKYKYRSVSGFAGPNAGEMTCVVWKMVSGQLSSAAKDPSDGTTSLEGNRVDFLYSTALFHGVTTQVSPSWWTSGLVFTEDENQNYECYMERDQAELMITPNGEKGSSETFGFEDTYHHVSCGTIARGEGYATNYANDCLMLPKDNASKSGAGLHTYVGKYNWFTGGAASAGNRSVRGFRRGGYANYAALSPLTMHANNSPSSVSTSLGFGTCCVIVD